MCSNAAAFAKRGRFECFRPTGKAEHRAEGEEVALLLSDHLSNPEIAAQLGIKLGTVKHHVHNVLEKLAVSRRSEAAARQRPEEVV